MLKRLKQAIIISLLPAIAFASPKKLDDLANKFEANKEYYMSSKFNEAKTRQEFIDPMFEALGWDINNDEDVMLHSQDSIPEARMNIIQTTKYVDYALRQDGRAVFFIEAKAANKDIDNPDYIFQSKRYAWSSGHADIVILTDYETLRVYDARIKPNYDKPNQGLLKQFSLNYKDYGKKFKLLNKNFSKSAVKEGSLDRLLKRSNKNLERIPMSENLVKDLESLRLKLAQDIFANNKDIEEKELSEASQNILNKIMFARILEDRDITPTKRLYFAISNYNQDKSLSMEDKGEYLRAEKLKPAQETLFLELQQEFKELSKRYHGVVFKPHFSDNLKVSDEILEEVITELYGDKSAYDFANVPMHVIGKAYETYLGKTISIEDGKVEMREKPEVKSAGGVFYTPKWVADYMVKSTLGEKLKGKDISVLKEIKVLDPACGSGVFPASIANELFAFAESYYNEHPNKIGGSKQWPDAIKRSNGEYVLSAKKKAEIIEDTLYCTDIDAQAIENTKMWLYILMLEDSGSYVADKERRYRIPNKAAVKKLESFKLPSLEDNIINANSLVGSDFGTQEENKEVLAYDWNTGKIGDIIKSGGFDVIIGNPPYIRAIKMKKEMPLQYEYLKDQYKTMKGGHTDIYYAFFEKFKPMLNKTGNLSFITSNAILLASAADSLRDMVKDNVSEIVNFANFKVFESASVSAVITTLNASNTTAFYYKRFPNVKSTEKNINEDKARLDSKYLNANSWNFPESKNIDKITKIIDTNKKLKDYADTLSRITTGNDDILILDKELTTGFEKECLKPIVLTKDVSRYEAINPQRYVIYAYDNNTLMDEEQFEKKCPNLYSYLKNYRKELSKRSGVDEDSWFAVRIGDVKINKTPKIMMGWRKEKQAFSLDYKGDLLYSSGAVTSVVATSKISIEALLGILNSSLLRDYFQYASPFLIGGAPQYPANVIKNVPMPEYNKKTAPIYEKIEEYVKAIYEVDDSEAKLKLEEKIDELVEKLYGINTTASIEDMLNQNFFIVNIAFKPINSKEVFELAA